MVVISCTTKRMVKTLSTLERLPSINWCRILQPSTVWLEMISKRLICIFMILTAILWRIDDLYWLIDVIQRWLISHITSGTCHALVFGSMRISMDGHNFVMKSSVPHLKIDVIPASTWDHRQEKTLRINRLNINLKLLMVAFQDTDICWLVVWIISFSMYWECHHPNWLILFRGVETTNQYGIATRDDPGSQGWMWLKKHESVGRILSCTWNMTLLLGVSHSSFKDIRLVVRQRS